MANILIIIPHDRFNDEELKIVSSKLRNEGHAVEIGSTHHTEAEGHFGFLVKPDVDIFLIEPTDYQVMIFIGGRGIEELLKSSELHSKIIDFFYAGKLICALGMAVEILAQAGIVAGKKVTCDSETITKVQYAGGFYTGGLTEEDGNIITASGEVASEEFAKIVNAALEYENRLKELRNARTTRS